MTERNRLFLLVAVMAGVCLVSGGLEIFLIFDAVQDWGATQGVDVAAMRGPFVRAVALGGLSAAVAIALCAYLFTRLSNPLIKRLRDNEAQTRAILETAVDGIITIDTRGNILSFNRASETIFGYRADEVVGHNIKMLMPEPYHSEHDGYLHNYLTTGEKRIIGIGREVEARRQDGTEFPVELAVSEVRQGENVTFTGIVRDITARKLAEGELLEAHEKLRDEQAKLIQAEKLSSIGLLASGVAHEINNPLSGVMACVKALRAGTLSEARQVEYFDTASDGLERIQSIVRDLLDYARQRPIAPVELDAGDCVEACLRLIAPVIRKKDAGVSNHLSGRGIALRGDRSQLMQALMNILLNAVHAAPRQGKIEVTAREGDGEVGICVEDDGPGISADVIGRVRDPFFTTKAEGQGTGLGLAVTDGIIRAHDGRLEIESTEGAGTAVTMWLPQPGDET